MSRHMMMLTAALGLVMAAPAVADPVDNPGDARFAFYDNPGAPFLHFSSGVNVSSNNPSGGPSLFEANVDSFGNMAFNGATMQLHPTGQTVGGTAVDAQLFVSDVTGTIDLSAGVSINLTFTAQYRFRAAASGVTTANCRTGNVSITITGNWGNTTSAAYTIPALTGAGTGACNGFAASLNTTFGLGSSGATLSMYKFSAKNIATGANLVGSP